MAEDGGGGAAGDLGVEAVGADDSVEGGDGGDACFVDEEVGAEFVDRGEGGEEFAQAREVGPFGDLIRCREELAGDVLDLEIVVEEEVDEGAEGGGIRDS